jgi:hypothetical protein
VLWSGLDWRRTDHPWLKDLLRSYLRYILAFTMLGYGLAKVFTQFSQFPPVEFDQLNKTYGESSPMNLVWTFMGASRGYTMFAGLGEVIAALLLIWRHTAILGAAVALGVMLNVMMLNFLYDVPVKQYSAHLCAMAVMIMLPDASRLLRLLVFNRPVDSHSLRPPYTNQYTIWVQRAFKAYLIVMGIGLPLYSSITAEWFPSEPRIVQPDHFGGYVVEEFKRDGEVIPPRTDDPTRWRTFYVRRLPSFMNRGLGPTDIILVRMMDQSPISSRVTFSQDQKTMTLESGAMGSVPGELTLEVLPEERLRLTGTTDGKAVEVTLKKRRREDYLLINRGFRWINEFPFNR